MIKGLIVGIFVSLPAGPAGFYSIRKTLEHGWLVGFITCLSIVIADLIYASIAGRIEIDQAIRSQRSLASAIM